eukprot:759900-Hanusia_phi.AAC.2
MIDESPREPLKLNFGKLGPAQSPLTVRSTLSRTVERAAAAGPRPPGRRFSRSGLSQKSQSVNTSHDTVPGGTHHGDSALRSYRGRMPPFRVGAGARGYCRAARRARGAGLSRSAAGNPARADPIRSDSVTVLRTVPPGRAAAPSR